MWGISTAYNGRLLRYGNLIQTIDGLGGADHLVHASPSHFFGHARVDRQLLWRLHLHPSHSPVGAKETNI